MPAKAAVLDHMVQGSLYISPPLLVQFTRGRHLGRLWKSIDVDVLER